MKNNKLQIGIEEVRKITMTDIEKEKIFTNILNSSLEEKKPIRSTWVSYSFFASFYRNNLVYYVVVPLIIILASGGVAFASQNSLPDSILYPVKVNIVEPIRETLSFTPKAKANYESKLASNRLAEAETLARQNKLDSSSEDKINNLLIKHTQALDKAIRKMNHSGFDGVSDKIITNFSEEMNTHANTLESITKEKSKKPEIKKSEPKIKTEDSHDTKSKSDNSYNANIKKEDKYNTSSKTEDRYNTEIKTEDENTTENKGEDNILNLDENKGEEVEKSDDISDHNKISKTAIISAMKIKDTSDRIKEEGLNIGKNRHNKEQEREQD